MRKLFGSNIIIFVLNAGSNFGSIKVVNNYNIKIIKAF